MCGLCGILGAEDHWTDAAGHTTAFGNRGIERTRRQERLYRVGLANTVLKHYGLSLRDWQGTGYVLSTHTGMSVMVDHLAAMWPVAARLAKRPCDPLDSALIAALERAA